MSMTRPSHVLLLVLELLPVGWVSRHALGEASHAPSEGGDGHNLGVSDAERQRVAIPKTLWLPQQHLVHLAAGGVDLNGDSLRWAVHSGQPAR